MNLDFLKLTQEKQKILAIHVVLSLIIFIILFASIKYFWFPGNLIAIDGGWTVIKLIAGVDIVLGPMLTLFFIHPERASFKKDFATIITIQILALAAGIWTVVDQRTTVIVFSGDKFYTIANGTLNDATVKLAKLDIKPSTYTSNEHNVLNMAFVTDIGYGKNLEDTLNNYPELPVRPDLFKPLKNHWPAIQKYKITDPRILANIRSHSLMSGKQLFKFDADIYHLKGRYKEAFIIFDSSTNKVIDIIVDKEIKQ